MIGGSPINGTYTYTSAAGTVPAAGTNLTEGVTFTPQDSTDYPPVNTIVVVNVAQATPNVSVNSFSLSYGTALANSQLSGTAKWLVGGAQVNVPGAYSYTSAAGTVLGAGNGQTESVTFTPQDTTDYDTVTTSVTIDVGPVVPTVSVNLVKLTYGTALDKSQLGAAPPRRRLAAARSALPARPTPTRVPRARVLGGGNGPDRVGDLHLPKSAARVLRSHHSIAVTINVAQATPVVSVNPVDLAYGTALANAQLSGGASWTVNGAVVNVPGTFSYKSAGGTVLNAGSGQMESVTFTPQDSTDYSTATATVTINVSAAAPVTLTLATIPAQSVDVGQALELNVSRFASETNAPTLSLTYSLGSGAPSGATIIPTTGVLSWPVGANQQIGTYPITVQVADNGSPQHTASETFNVSVVDPSPVTISGATVHHEEGFHDHADVLRSREPGHGEQFQ